MARYKAIATAVLVLAMHSTATAQNSVWNAAPLSTSAAAIMDAAARIPAPAGANLQIFLHQERYVFDAQGRSTSTTHNIYRILTPTAVRAQSTVSTDWRPWNEDRPEIRARVI